MHLFFVNQTQIARSSSALLNPKSPTQQTASLASLLYLITGKDASEVDTPENRKLKKARREAIIAYIDESVKHLGEKIVAMEEEQAAASIPNLDEATASVQAEIDSVQREIDTAITESRSLMEKIYAGNSKISEYDTIRSRFESLQSQYTSDMERLAPCFFLWFWHLLKGKTTVHRLFQIYFTTFGSKCIYENTFVYPISISCVMRSSGCNKAIIYDRFRFLYPITKRKLYCYNESPNVKTKAEQSFCYAPKEESGCILSKRFSGGILPQGWRRRKHAGMIHISGCICRFTLGFCKNKKERTETLYQSFSPFMWNDSRNDTIHGFHLALGLSFCNGCSWVHNSFLGCKSGSVGAAPGFRFVLNACCTY